jgi:ADP-heptose:LPS heptosyltransferase/GT2 family glycosyltransferase
MEALFSDYETIRKSGLFDPEHYVTTYPDVEERNVDPLVHYLEEGAREGRDPHSNFDTAFYLEQCKQRGEEPANPLLHYILIGAARGFKTRRDGAGVAAPSGDNRNRPDAAAKVPILLNVESLGIAGTAGGGSRLSVNGWALAAAPITEISAAVNGTVVGKAVYGLARPDIGRLYPGRNQADHSGFILSFDLPATAGRVIEPLLTVRTADGEIGRRPLRVDIPPQQVEAPPIGTELMQLGIDEAVVDGSGILRVAGWVVCLVQLESVEVFIDGERLGEAELGRVRDDVEKTHPDYPNSRFAGFLLLSDVGDLGAGSKTVAVKIVARTGISRVLTAEVDVPERIRARATATDRIFYHHCDEITLTPVGDIRLRGWVVGGSPTASIRVALDDGDIGEAELGIERANIGNLFPMLPHARRSGFVFAYHAGRPLRGAHQITLRVRGDDSQIREIAVPAGAGGDAPEASGIDSGNTVGDADRKLQLDAPAVIGGAMELPVRGDLEIAGWALARAGVAAIEIAIDGTPMATARYGVRRLDVRAAFPGWSNALGSGFLALVPNRVLSKGAHQVGVTLRDQTGGTASLEFRIQVEELAERSGPWSLRRKMALAEIAIGQRILERQQWQPLFQIVLPVATDDAALTRACTTIASLRAQIYPHWRLAVVVEPRAIPAGAARDRFAAELDRIADRVEVMTDLTSQALASQDEARTFLTMLMPGDELGCDALFEMAVATAGNREADFLYSDERRRNPATGNIEAFFKPQWSPDLLLSTNYIGRLWCARAALLRSIAGPAEDLLAHGDYDLVLRCTEAAKAIRHVPAVLCERVEPDRDDGERDRRALERAIARRGIAGEVRPGLVSGTYQVKRSLTSEGLVSIIIPTCAADGMIETCIESLRRLTAYPNFEIICIENIPPADRRWREWLQRNADRVISTDEPFNWSRFNNLAVAEAKGEFLLFLNDDIEIIEPDWLDVLVEQAQRPEVGVIGPQLLYPDRRVQHAGLFLAAMAQGRHAFRYAAEDEPGYFGLALTQRNVIAVTGACLVTRHDSFAALGGFDEAHAIINNDVDYCLRAWQSGLVNLYTPHVRLIHHEAISRAGLEDDYDEAAFVGKWRDLFLAGDPYFNPHLSKNFDDLIVDYEPTQIVVSGRPTIDRHQIRRILVIKLDHIGDCITSFPAVRRLKQHFPDARVSVLTSAASRPVWSMEPCIAETIDFDFFHPISAQGQLELGDEDWRSLGERLTGRQFDLAVDLRKHPETRPVLQHIGARYLAGFDHRNLFSWLDVALEWGGDEALARKRQHTADDLVNLVDAIAVACEEDRQVIVPPRPELPPDLAREIELSAGRPLVCVHPCAGSETRQWPTAYFAPVVDRLAEADRAQIVLIGAPGEEPVADDLTKRLRHPEAVVSLVGKLPLAELPGLLTTCSLFLGNNSGPHHIAAGLGVPTVGVHSGSVDVREWGPVGPAAVAVAREVICSPCYLAMAKDCPRGLACLRELTPETVYDACRRMLLLAAPSPASNTARAVRTSTRPARRTAAPVPANPQ